MGSGTDAADETLAEPGKKRSGELVAGARLGKYKLDRILGSGGMGVVWAAHDPDLERAVALKVLRYEHAGPELRQRLLREARAMAKLKHPNVLTVYEVDSEGERDFIAMELVEGASLDEWIATKPPRDDIWHAIIGAGRGLAAAHAANLVHRDFKPHNVLRGGDGRVLVTDFGLARGHDDKVPAATPIAPVVATPSGLEATIDATPTPPIAKPASEGAQLTRTGALLGTPAYMAPEQFLGVAPDPRTDQFAFCVSAWQLLTGERPFRGDTLDELRRAAAAGVANVKGDLPRAIRGVLVRGLDPDPAKRWPDMNALLAALERAKGRNRRVVQVALLGATLAVGTVVAVKLVRAPANTVESSSACDTTPEVEVAKAWSPALHRAFVTKFGDSPGAQLVANQLDAFATQWAEDYHGACTGPRSTHTFAKLGCLLGERDIVAGMAELMPSVPANVIEQIEMGGVLPRLQACEGPSPIAPPTMPDDLAERDKIRALRPKLIASRWEPTQVVLAAMPDLVKQAEALGWDPIIAEAHAGYAIAAERANEWELARDQFKAALDYARRSHHDQLAAETVLAVLGGEIQAATDPTSDSAFDDLVAQARLAIKSAGNDPHFIAQLAELEAVLAAARGHYDEAIAKYDTARKTAVAIRNLGYATRLATDDIMATLRRDRPGDVDIAWAMAAEVDRAVTTAHLPANKLFGVASIASYIGHVRGDLAAAHAWADRIGKPTPPTGAVAITGRVIGADGKPIGGAMVVAWKGELAGDPTRAYLDPRFAGAVATTGADGTFTVQGVRGGGIIAELADQRSEPHLIGDGALTLALAATRAVAGTVASDDELVTGVVAIAYYQLGSDVSWQCIAPVDRTRAYHFAGLPPGAATLRLANWLDPNAPTRKLDFGPLDKAAPRWPAGPAIDAIVHGNPDASIWVFRDHPTARTHADLDRLTAASRDVTIHPALVIGIGDQTAEGMKHYMRGDQHGVLLANAPGEVTVCAAAKLPTAPATCKTIVIPKLAPEHRDGRGVYPTVPVVLP